MAHSPPPLKSAMGTREWLDWFARLNDFLDAAPLIIEKKTFNAEASWNSPTLEKGFIYRITWRFYASNTAANLLLQLYSGGSLQTGASDYHYEGAVNGTAFSTNNDAFHLGNLGATVTDESHGNVLITNLRDPTRETLFNGTTADFSAGPRQRIVIGNRQAAEDNEQFQINADGAYTLTGDLILERMPFVDQ